MESDGRRRPLHLAPNEGHNAPVIIYVTVCTKNRKQLLADLEIHRHLRDTWKAHSAWLVGRYVIMPDHVHFFCAPGDLRLMTFPEWMKFWKSHSARFWPYRNHTPVWQREYWDTELRRHESYAAGWDYVEMNPVRAGLVETPEEWPYQGELNELSW